MTPLSFSYFGMPETELAPLRALWPEINKIFAEYTLAKA